MHCFKEVNHIYFLSNIYILEKQIYKCYDNVDTEIRSNKLTEYFKT